MKTTAALAFLSLGICYASTAHADSFGSGPNTFDIDFVTIGDANNAADVTGEPNPAGSVAKTYRIGKFEISEDMIDKANTLGGLGITHDGRGANKPATSVSWFEAAKFVNWLNGSTPAYKFDTSGNFQLWTPGDAGYDASNKFRNSQATYFLPSMDEWYKAAFYDPTGIGTYYDYPNGSDTAPTAVASGTTDDTAVWDQAFNIGPADITLAGGLSPYGTMGQGGNVWEWQETEYDLVNDSTSAARGDRGGAWDFNSDGMASDFWAGFTTESIRLGFRVASIPEPSTLLLGALAAVGLLMRRRSLR